MRVEQVASVEPAVSASRGRLLRAMPAVFVLIWSTGFIVARYGMPHSPPLKFLAWRYAFSAGLFGAWIAMSRVTWPAQRRQWAHLAVTGLLIQAGYLGGVWAAVKDGIAAGTVALIVGLQPVLTALWVAWSGEERRMRPTQWLGLLLGLSGLLLVVWRKLGGGEIDGVNLSLAIFALLCITAGTLYQKRFVRGNDVRTAIFIQLLASLAVTAPLALLEPEAVTWAPEMIGALAWSVVGLTFGSSTLLFLLIQRGAATRVTSLMYLVPPCTALQAWWLFGESLSTAVLAGLALTAIGVALVVREA